jgi:hypothetical protein
MADEKPKAVRGPGGKFLKRTTLDTGLAMRPVGKTVAELLAPLHAEDAAQAYSPGYAPGSFVWAADHIVNGRTVRRACRLGNKAIGTSDPSRNILENEDFLAHDWVLV